MVQELPPPLPPFKPILVKRFISSTFCGSAPLNLTISKGKILTHFFTLKFDFFMLKTILISLWGSQKCFFHAHYDSATPLSDHFVTDQQQTVRKN